MPASRPILIVDDNADDVRAVRRLALKFRIANPLLSMHSAESAISYLKGEGAYADRKAHPLPVLILLDLVMPGIGGMAVLEWLQVPKNEIPVVVLTGMENLRQMGLAYQKGAHSLLMKPFDERDFAGVVRQFKGIDVVQ